MADATLQSHLPIQGTYSAEYFEYYRLLPLELAEGVLRVAVAGTPNEQAVADLSEHFDYPVEILPVELAELKEAIRRTFAAQESVLELVRDLTLADSGEQLESDVPLADIRDLALQPPVIRFVNLLIREAQEANASDIHLEAAREGLRVRIRVDGVLSELPAPPAGLHAAVVSRIKLLAELDIAERRAPQDGRIRVRLESAELDLRVSTVPTLFGESVVLRLLGQGQGAVSLDELGMSPDMLEDFRRLAARPHGIVLATGPTGSGKTTTLYSALGLRHPSQEKIITVEDPIEYHLTGVTQVPVHARAGVTFASALRSILRQDPDVLMVGEMRDPETAAIAIQAAMTGHLVFSTLHTNDAVSALARLTDLSVERYMVAATVEGILAQRLVRRICAECQETYIPDASLLSFFEPAPARPRPLQRGRGCSACRETGYRGRVGIFELLTLTDSLKDGLISHESQQALRERAREQGMQTMRADGWRKVLGGLTTVEEVLRVSQ